MDVKVRKSKSPALVIRVNLDGQVIQERNSTETFITCLKIGNYIGFDPDMTC